MKKKNDKTTQTVPPAAIHGEPITETLERNFMPYAMSVIISRAVPDIDGFKPSHRKLLYTMYKMGLLTGARTKSANIVGQTMKLNPHGDAAIYDTMVRLAKGYDALLHPYVDSKGNFGKVYSRDMAWAASRYTEAKLDPICAELFRDIDKETVDFVDNYDGSMKEPSLLPVTFPNILVNPNQGIAVGMASNICSFNLQEVCETAVALIRDPGHDLAVTLKAPDFSTGGLLLYNGPAMRDIYETGRGSFKLRARWNYDKNENCIEITEIPYTTTVEAIIDKLAEHIKNGKLREVSDVRDETDLNGLKLTIDLKRGTDPDKLMTRLYKQTTLEDSFSCNFNVLIAGTPRVMGVRELLHEWTAFRTECVKRQLHYDMARKKERLHLLLGLKAILLDVDRAVRIVRDTESDDEVVPNLMIGFGIDETQAEFIAEIKLRNLNKQYVLKKLEEIDGLREAIADIEATLSDKNRLKKLLINDLQAAAKKYSRPRRTEIVFEDEVDHYNEEEHIEDYPVTLFLTKEGYFKKITPQSLRMSSEQKLKDGDAVSQTVEAQNKWDLLFFTDKQQVYKARAFDFEDTKASVLGEYLPARLQMDPEESVVFMAVTADYAGDLLFFFEDGKCARVALSGYETKTNRKKLTGAYGGKSPLVAAFHISAEREYLLTATNGKLLLMNTGAVAVKTTRSTQGVAVMTLRAKQRLYTVEPYSDEDGRFVHPNHYRTKNLPAAGVFLRDEDKGSEQQTL